MRLKSVFSMPRIASAVALAGAALFLWPAQNAPAESVQIAAGGKGGPVVVELFTSQGCYSCPPAEKFLTELAKRKDVVALEWHVHYWDELVYGSAGKWKDIYSDESFTRRQRLYNLGIKGRPSAYTPQMVVDGRYDAVGSRSSEVFDRLRRSKADSGARLDVTATTNKDGTVEVSLDGDVPQEAAVFLVSFLKSGEVEILAGENKGKTLKHTNIVRQMWRIGDWSGTATTLRLQDMAPKEGHGCAVLVQADRTGPMLGAAYCDSGASS